MPLFYGEKRNEISRLLSARTDCWINLCLLFLGNIMPKIYKHTIEVVLLSEDQEIERSLGAEWDLATVERAMSTGDCIGTYSHKETQEIPADDLENELIAIGNDGSFFDPLDD